MYSCNNNSATTTALVRHNRDNDDNTTIYSICTTYKLIILLLFYNTHSLPFLDTANMQSQVTRVRTRPSAAITTITLNA